VILAHGFLRNQGRMAGLARALAYHGIPAVTLNLCNSRPWDGRPIRNGLDMIAVARRIGAKSVVYAGFSAGGLAALVAGRLDRQALGVLTLDLVDNGGIGTGMARALDRPLIGLAGDPAACNARNNGIGVFATAPRARLTPIAGASHCDFESPTDWLCESLCTGVNNGSQGRRQAIIAMSVAAVSDLIGLTGSGLAASRPARLHEAEVGLMTNLHPMTPQH
jgi:pimeloyl-ACP methyl ester carboxylesterase